MGSGRGSKVDHQDAEDETSVRSAPPLRRRETACPPSAAMSAGLARNWWAVGLRGIATILFGLGILLLPSPTIASLVLMFVAYIAADGAFAILAGARAASREERWWTLILEGLVNLMVAGAVLVWWVLAVVPLVRLASAWAVVTGALMLAAARRLSGPHGRWVLALAGTVSAVWGALAAALGPASASDPRTAGSWLIAYALVFGVTLLILAVLLRQRHRGG